MTFYLPQLPLILATSLFGSTATLLLALVPLLAAALLLRRAAHGRPDARPGTSVVNQAALRTELLDNYEHLRRHGEAVPLTATAWQRLCARRELSRPAVSNDVAQAYRAIEISNRLLTASGAYDSRGLLSIKQRRLALWPTLETAIRAALAALGCAVAPAVQLSALKPCLASEEGAVAESAFAPTRGLGPSPRLTLVYADASQAAAREAASVEPARASRKNLRRRAGARLHLELEGQMPLWESVA